MAIGAGSPDALLELARVVNITAGVSGSSDLRVDTGMTAARTAIAAAESLDEADEQVARLLDPVPAEIYLALAERALATDEPDLAKRSLEHATTTALNEAVRGEAHDQLAALAQHAGDGEQERTERLAAAIAWDRAERADRALASAAALVVLDPQHAEARCRVASSLILLSWATPKEIALPQLRRALEVNEPVAAIVEAQALQLTDRDWLRAWALWNEGSARRRLAAFDGEPRADHRWRALLAALRTVAVVPTNGSMWTGLADAAFELDLLSMAELAAGKATRLDPSRDKIAQHVRALANLGEFERALDVLGDPTNPFEWNMQAHVRVRLGQARTAAAVFDAHRPEPDSQWARLSHVTSLLLVDRRAEAVAAAKDLDASLRARLSETEIRSVAARESLILGNDERVEALTTDLRASGEHNSDFELAVVRTVQGRHLDAASLFASYVRSFTSQDDVACWEHIDLDVLALVLADRGDPLPDLSEAQRELDELRTRSVARRDPLAELDLADSDGADDTSVAAAKDVGRTIVAVAGDDLQAVEAGIGRLDAALGGVPTGPLRRVAGRTAASAAGRGRRSCRGGRPLRRRDAACERTPRGGADEHRRPAACGVTGRCGPEGGLCGALSSRRPQSRVVRPARGESARSRTARRRCRVCSEQCALSTQLPPSWFAAVRTPTEQHELFLRHFPEMRLVIAATIPGIHVSTDAALEPSGYRVLVHDDVVEVGTLPIGRRLLPGGALHFCPPSSRGPPLARSKRCFERSAR